MRSLALLLYVISVVNGLGDRSFTCEDYEIVNEYPFLARIMYGKDLICGGTIISNQYILTSAECVYKREPSDLVVFVGADFEYEDGGVRHLVGEVQRHRVHKSQRISAIALLRVVEDIKFSSAIQPITLSSSTNFPVGKTATLIGWDAEMCMAGEREEKILPQEICTDPYRICTFSEIGSFYDPCYNLLGNPLTLNSIQIGINNGHVTCSSSRNSYTMVGLHMDWINEKTGQPTVSARNQEHSITYYIIRIILILLFILLIYLFRLRGNNLWDIYWSCLSYLSDAE